MHERTFRRGAILAAALLLATASGAFADTVPGDADDLAPGIQGTVAVGPVATGGSIAVPLWFALTCRGLSHVDPGQSVTLTFRGGTAPAGGAVTSTGTVVGPAPTDWPADGQACPTGASLRSAEPATVTLTAPQAAGTYDYVVDYARGLSPAGSADATALTSLSGATFRLTVVANTPPILAVPADLVVEGDTTGGAHVTFPVGATDAEDDPDPAPACDPVSGAYFALGATSVSCSVTDSAGASASGSFTITVHDTTPPDLGNVPTGIDLVTTDPAGAPVVYLPPTAIDVVDPAPVVSCSPAPGALVPVGDSTVTCTAADASGNVDVTAFPLRVTYVAPVVLEARFEAPVGPGGAVFGAAGRTVPVKVHLLRDGQPVTGGAVELGLARCGDRSAAGAPRPLAWRQGRWMLLLATDGLAGCLRATVRVNGREAGGFELRLGAPASEVRATSGRS